MEREGVTLQVPPNSVHFDAKACMKPPKTANADSVTASEGQNPAPAPQIQVQPFHPWMYQYPPQGYPPQYPYPPGAHLNTVPTITIRVPYLRITRHSRHLVRLFVFMLQSRIFVPVTKSQNWMKQNWPPSSINRVIMPSSNLNVQIGRKSVSHPLGGKHFWMLTGVSFAMLELVSGTVSFDSLFFLPSLDAIRILIPGFVCIPWLI